MSGMSSERREAYYLRQTGGTELTPRQRRRRDHKAMRALFGNAGGARLRKRHERRLRTELRGRVVRIFGRKS